MHSGRREATQRGFTLLELLVVLAVLLVIVLITLIGISNYAHRQSYEATVSHVRESIASMREKTLASYNDAVYGVYVGTSSIEFFKGSTPKVGSSSSEIITYASAGITATSSFANKKRYITFSRLTGEASATGTITVSDAGGKASTTFTVYGSGLVQ